AQLAALQTKQAADLRALSDADAELGASLKTGDAFAAVRHDLEALATATPSDDSFAMAVTDIQALIAQIGDGSSLILDPALDSYYLMDAVVVEFPSAQDSTSQIRALVYDVAQRGHAEGDDRVTLKVLAGTVQGRIDTV